MYFNKGNVVYMKFSCFKQPSWFVLQAFQNFQAAPERNM